MPALKHDPTQRMLGAIIYCQPGTAHANLGRALDVARGQIADTARLNDAWLIGKLRAEWSRVPAWVTLTSGGIVEVRALLVESDVGTHVDAILQLEREASS